MSRAAELAQQNVHRPEAIGHEQLLCAAPSPCKQSVSRTISHKYAAAPKKYAIPFSSASIGACSSDAMNSTSAAPTAMFRTSSTACSIFWCLLPSSRSCSVSAYDPSIFLPFFQQLCHRILPLRARLFLPYTERLRAARRAVQHRSSCKNAQCRANSSLLIAPRPSAAKAQSPVPA